MIELSAEWLTEVARQSADEEDAWYAARPTWLALADEPSAVVRVTPSIANADKRWAERFPALARRRSRSDIQRWRDDCAKQAAPVLPLFITATPKSAA